MLGHLFGEGPSFSLRPYHAFIFPIIPLLVFFVEIRPPPVVLWLPNVIVSGISIILAFTAAAHNVYLFSLWKIDYEIFSL